MKILIPTILIFVLACNGKPEAAKLTGDLYFGILRIGSYYNQPDSMINWFETNFDTTNYEKADAEQRRYLNLHKTLKEEGLLYHPFVQIKNEKDSVVNLYLEISDYDRIKKYKRKELLAEGKRVRIEADVKEIGDGLFYCINLLKVERIQGSTSVRSSKWKIDDYN